MKELLTESLSKWNLYWDGGWYHWIFAAALLYLLICKRKKDHVRNILLYVLAMLFVFWCPLTAFVIRKCIGKNVYWRVLWLLLSIPVCALAATEFIKERKKIPVKLVMVMLVAGIAMFSGKSMLEAGVYEKAHNNQKIPYEAVVICDMVKAHAGEAQVHLAVDDYLAAYVRVYDASITMPYGRMGRDSLDKNCKKLYKEICSPEANYVKVAARAVKAGCNYVACVVYDENGRELMEENGFQVIGEVNQYTVFACEM